MGSFVHSNIAYGDENEKIHDMVPSIYNVPFFKPRNCRAAMHRRRAPKA